MEHINMSAAIAVGSALIHAEELLEGLRKVPDLPSPVQFDIAALQTCLDSVELQNWLEKFPRGLLPVKRHR